jgi:hypothetical protein
MNLLYYPLNLRQRNVHLLHGAKNILVYPSLDLRVPTQLEEDGLYQRGEQE